MFNPRAIGVPLLGALWVLSVVLMANTASAAGPVLWNRLGSSNEVSNSSYGPNLQQYNGYTSVDWPATPSYVPGVFGNAITIGDGYYRGTYRMHNAVLSNLNQYLNPDRGTIEVWYKQNSDPVAYAHNCYRIFDGTYGLGSGMTFDSEAVKQNAHPMLYFGLTFGGAGSVVQYDISPYNGSWIHLAGVWDRAGIGGSSDKLRLYFNGQVVAATDSAAWGSTVGSQADIAGGNDYGIANQFYEDNLKVFDYALTDFSHRFQEDWLPEPGSLGLLGLGAFLLACGRSQRFSLRPGRQRV